MKDVIAITSVRRSRNFGIDDVSGGVSCLNGTKGSGNLDVIVTELLFCNKNESFL